MCMALACSCSGELGQTCDGVVSVAQLDFLSIDIWNVPSPPFSEIMAACVKKTFVLACMLAVELIFSLLILISAS